MDKVTQFLVIITAACLILAACTVKPSVITPAVDRKSVSPTVGSTPEKGPDSTATVTNPAPTGPSVDNTPQKTLVITGNMKGQSVSLAVGDTFEIQLSTIPMPGFEWTPKDLDTTILLEEGKPVYTADSSPNSAGGTVTLRFKVVGAGKTHLTLLYLHPAENGSPSLYNNSFGVNIEGK